MPLFSFGGPQYDIQDSKIASRVGDGTWGANVDVPSVQMLRGQLRFSTATLEGDARETDTHARAIGGQMTLRFGSVSLAVLEIMLGRDLETSGSTPNRSRRIRVTDKKMPYFAICGRSEATQGDGDTHIFAPMCKVTEDFDIISLEYGSYSIPEVTVTCLADEYYSVGGEDAVQTVTISGTPTGGTFTLTFAGATTSAIAYNAASSAVQTALQALSTIGSGNALVTGSAGGPYTVTFAGDLAQTPVPLMTASGAALTGGSSPSVAVAQTTAGEMSELVIFDILEYETARAVSIPPLV